MKSMILKSFIWWLTFFFTILLCFVWYAAWINLTEVEEEHTLTTWRWNEMVTKLNYIWNKVETAWNIPSWAVMSFNLSTCPTWWKVSDWNSWTQDLRWAFIRWINWNLNWRDVERILWHYQVDELKSHSHETVFYYWVDPGWNYDNGTNIAAAGPYSRSTSSFWWSETRPKNVALLYCEKE